MTTTTNTTGMLPETPQTLTGGCFCRAIRYTVSIPALEERPECPSHLARNPFGPQSASTDRLPLVSFDHCHSCRHMNGSLFMNWLITPQSWISFTLLTRPKEKDDADATQEEQEEPEETHIQPAVLEVLRPGPGSQPLDARTHLRYFASSPDARRSFCGRCGTAVAFYYSGSDNGLADQYAWGPYCDLNLGTLDDEVLERDGLRPSRNVHYAEAVSWVRQILDVAEKSV
ncbi:Mss4-like protein [Phlyctema vagabunda]|uniref:Mss4-like protein n=1 Tax=Phlyctema vagabunda TaxID=108571 RepID=A0ABR4PKC7_9HELO